MDYVLAFGAGVFSITFMLIFFELVVAAASLFRKEGADSFQPEISVIIPAYNEEERIAGAVASAFGLDYPKDKIEVIVVDDGSADKTVEVAGNAGAKVVRQGHLGKTDALNLGVRESRADFVITLDADTVLGRGFASEIMRYFADEKTGAVSGAIKVLNTKSFLGMFQEIEYGNINLIRSSFSKMFGFGVWFFGSVSCYRKSALKKVGFFKKNTVSEDMDIALELQKNGFKVLSSGAAEGYTLAPETMKKLFSQRRRWWVGGLQTLSRNKVAMTGEFPLKFILFNQYWWSFYAFVSLPLFIYQIVYWLPAGPVEVASYLFRWFSLAGPFYVLYKLPEWGVSFYSIFGVAAGVASALMSALAVKMFRIKVSWRSLTAFFFFFPYTILLNLLVCAALLASKPKGHFVKA